MWELISYIEDRLHVESRKRQEYKPISNKMKIC